MSVETCDVLPEKLKDKFKLIGELKDLKHQFKFVGKLST